MLFKSFCADLTDTPKPSKQSSKAVIKPSEDTFIDSDSASSKGILEPLIDAIKDVPETDISKPEYKGMTIKRKRKP
jgi:hypothetical protein